MHLSGFSNVWIVVCVASSDPGERITPLAIAAKSVATNLLVEFVAPELFRTPRPPYETGPLTLVLTSNAAMLVACHLALDWEVPERVVDLAVEQRNRTNGTPDPIGWQDRALPSESCVSRGGSLPRWFPQKLRQRLSTTHDLFKELEHSIHLGHSLLRGRYMAAVARIESAGLPVDRDVVDQLASRWGSISTKVIQIIDRGYSVYDRGRLDESAFCNWLNLRGIDWPRLPSGRLDLSDAAFRDMARAFPEIRNVKELRATVLDFDPAALTIGQDGRNRVPLRPFASRTGRNQPGAKASVLGSAVWVRQLIRPKTGTGLALIDWTQQEFGIAAALSGDKEMQQAYRSADPYLALAVLAGAAPISATPASHADVRAQFKICALGIQYGMGSKTLARLIGRSEATARDLQRLHRAAFPAYWRWSDDVETHAFLTGHLKTVFGWNLNVCAGANPRSLRNFPLQANGAEMLRLACCLATEAGVQVCMPLHDALMIEAPLDELDETIERTRGFMAEASTIVLDGFPLRTSVRSVRSPRCWSEPKGARIWAAVKAALEESEPARECDETCSRRNSRPISLYDDKRDGSDVAD